MNALFSWTNQLFQVLVSGTFIQKVSENLILNILAALGAGACIQISIYLYKKLLSYIRIKISNFTLNGYWISQFGAPDIESNERNIELVAIRQTDENINMKIHHYSNDGSKMVKFISTGFFRAGEIYTSYLDESKERGGGGVFLLKLKFDRLRHPVLDGFFIEFDRMSSEQNISKVEYTICRVNLSILHRIKLFIPGINKAFKNYSEIEEFAKNYDKSFSKSLPP